ncbi:MAG: DUF1156 domain-containing protein [Candidatus Aenigmatarchaeota archaeon]
MPDKRFIEESFPVKEVSEESAKEKNIRHGHISTLHIWWARRPLASSRATAYAALIPAAKNAEEWNKKRNFIIELCKWENSNNKNLRERARKDILEANDGKPPKVLDPFAGGGAIPLEALRLGCETYASDYNPVAVLIEKCTLEYPQRYGEKLVKDVKKWGEWVLEEAKKELAEFYPNDKEEKKEYFANFTEESIPVGYIWVRTIKCQNPRCEAEIPLMRQFWLAKKPGRQISLYPYVKGKKVEFKIVGTGYEKMPNDFNPEKGTVARAIATCLVCGNVVSDKDVRKQFQEGKAGQRMVAVVLHNPKKQGKFYRIATEKDFEAYEKAEEYLEKKRQQLIEEWGFDPVPDEELDWNTLKQRDVMRYGILKWGDLFNSRQKLALITFTEKVRLAYKKMLEEGYEKDYAKVVVSYLGLALTKLSPKSCNVSTWHSGSENPERTLAKNSIPMQWEYPESNIIESEGATGYNGNILQIVTSLSEIKLNKREIFLKIMCSSAISLPYPDNFFDAVFTDPPYYDNINYAELSDFFYVWLKRSIGDLYPDLFMAPLTPKSEEIVSNPIRHGDSEKAKQFFEDMIKKAFKEIYRVLKPNGIAIIVYAHKTTAGWETITNALLESGLTITASWPISTEMKSRLLAKETAALQSSIYIVARKIQKKGIGLYPKVRRELREYLDKKLERLWQEGISGADFFIAAIGAGIEVFGKYEKVIDDEGKEVKADKLLEEIREVTANFAVRQILHDGFTGEVSPLTRFYVLWRWNFGEAKVHFDEARKLAQSFGINLEREWNKGFIRKEKEFIRVLGPKERNIKDLEDSEELIDALHYVLLLWEKGEKEKLLKKLSESYGNSEAFYRVVQAITQCLPNESKEKKLLEGCFPSGKKERLMEEIRSLTSQSKLGRWVK